MTRFRLMFMLSALVILLSASLALGKGAWSKIQISGQGLRGVVEITDPQLLEGFALSNFEDFSTGSINPPVIIGEGYKMLRGWDDAQGKFMPFDEVHYYLNPTGGDGYLYYDGLVNGSSEYDHRWFRVTAQGEAAMQKFFAANDVEIDLANQTPARVLNGHTDAVNVLKWSPDGTLLASSAGGWDSKDFTVRLWSADDAHYHSLLGHNAPVQSIDWSPDGQTLATGSTDQTIRLWDRDGNPLQTFDVKKGIVFGLAWSPDGSLLASASVAGTTQNLIQVWKADGTLLYDLPTEYSGGKFLNVGWSPDGRYLVGGAVDYKEWRADGTPVFTHESCAHCTPAWGFGWSPDSQMWAMGNESGLILVYNVDGTQVAELHNAGNVDVLAWSSDGKLLAGGNAIWTWDGTAFKQTGGLGAGWRVRALAWSPDGSQLATASTNQLSIRLSDATGKPLNLLKGHTDDVEALAWSPDGLQLASGSADGTIRLWDTGD